MVSMGTVHTSGTNWESIGTLVTSFVLCAIGVARYITTRADRSRERTERFISAKVTEITEALTDHHLQEFKHTRRRRYGGASRLSG